MTNSSLTAAAPTQTHPGKAANIALWVLQILLALAFLGAASGKLLGTPPMVALYEAIGIGQWFRYVTGLLELTGAILIVSPRTTIFGAALLCMIMAGAVMSHLVILHTAPTAPAVLLLVAGVVAWGRRGALTPVLSRLSGVQS